MFSPGQRVIVLAKKGQHGTVIHDNGGGDYMVRMDDGERIGANVRQLRSVEEASFPMHGMVTKGSAAPARNIGLTQVLPSPEELTAAEEDEGREVEDEARLRDCGEGDRGPMMT